MTGYPSCKTCACFFRSHSGAREGQCRRKSPVPVMIGVAHAPKLHPSIIDMQPARGQPQPVINSYFPPVTESIWCMEWLPIDATPDEIEAHAEELSA